MTNCLYVKHVRPGIMLHELFAESKETVENGSSNGDKSPWSFHIWENMAFVEICPDNGGISLQEEHQWKWKGYFKANEQVLILADPNLMELGFVFYILWNSFVHL